MAGGYPTPDTSHLVQRDPSALVAAAREARAAGFDLSFAAQRKHASDNIPPALVHVDASGMLDAHLEITRFAFNPILPLGVVTLLGGHGGSGKSFLALVLAAHYGGGCSWAGLEVTPGRVLFVSLEDPGAVVLYRLRRIVEAYGLNAETVCANLTIVDGTRGDGVLATEVNDFGIRRLTGTATMDELRQLARGCTLVIVDNASDAYDGDENHRRQVRTFLRLLSTLARDNDAAVLLLAHIDKSAARFGAAGNSYSGSTAWHNSARSRLALIAKGGRIDLLHEKANLSVKADPIPLEWTVHGVLVPARPIAADDADDALAVLAALRAATANATDVGAGRTGPGNARSVLSTFPELPRRLSSTRGKDAFWAALDKLMKDGRVVAHELWTPGRHKRRVLVEAEKVRASFPHTPYAGTGETRDGGFLAL